jgi:hypothetical protein
MGHLWRLRGADGHGFPGFTNQLNPTLTRFTPMGDIKTLADTEVAANRFPKVLGPLL